MVMLIWSKHSIKKFIYSNIPTGFVLTLNVYWGGVIWPCFFNDTVLLQCILYFEVDFYGCDIEFL